VNAFVYICFNCPACERVVASIEENSLDAQVVNVQIEKPDIPRIQIFPALFIDDKLTAYGDDIINVLMK